MILADSDCDMLTGCLRSHSIVLAHDFTNEI